MNGIEFLKTANGNVFDVCAVCYMDYLKDFQNQSDSFDVFKHLISNDIVTDQSCEIKQNFFSDDYFRVFMQNKSVIDRAVNNMIEKHVEEKVFYQKLWDLMFDDLIFASDFDKVCALACMVTNKRIPYYKLAAPIDISDEEYIELSNSSIDEINKAEFIMNLEYEKKTDLASQLLMLLDQISEEHKKIVVLANALDVPNERIQILMEILKTIQEDDEDGGSDY